MYVRTYIHTYQSLNQSIKLSIYLSLNNSFLFVYLSFHLSFCLSIYLSIYRVFFLAIYLLFYLSVFNIYIYIYTYISISFQIPIPFPMSISTSISMSISISICMSISISISFMVARVQISGSGKRLPIVLRRASPAEPCLTWKHSMRFLILFAQTQKSNSVRRCDFSTSSWLFSSTCNLGMLQKEPRLYIYTYGVRHEHESMKTYPKRGKMNEMIKSRRQTPKKSSRRTPNDKFSRSTKPSIKQPRIATQRHCLFGFNLKI